jgi:translation initiation factor 3 subunit L
MYGCPKFVNPATPNFGVDSPTFGQETLRTCTRVFLNQLKQHHPVPTLRSYLKLYTTLPIQKLADFLEVKGDNKTLVSQLLAYKHKTREIVHGKGPALSGEIALASDVDFYIERDMIHIVETRVQKRYSEFFIWNTDKLLRQAKATYEPESQSRKGQKA